MNNKQSTRPRFARIGIVLRTAARTFGALRAIRARSLLPMIVILFAIAFLLMALATTGPLAPFIYPLL